ncbi:MAG: hypothetical protein IRY89_02885 [Pseudolabrys sp.]|nr:hypothetical protein [Pseudolabrys sp.]
MLGHTRMTRSWKPVCLVIVSILAVVPGVFGATLAADNPLDELNGSWAGRGTITLSNDSRERIVCRATYEVPGANFRLALKCASDSYKFDFRADGVYQGGSISGNWYEETRHAAGTFSGSARAHHIEARAEGQTFSALLSLSTHGTRQSISIRSPGSTLSEATIILSRRER